MTDLRYVQCVAYSKRFHPCQIFLFEFLHVLEAEADLMADPEAPDSMDAVPDDPLDCFCGDLPAPGELVYCEYLTNGLCYVLSDRGRFKAAH